MKKNLFVLMSLLLMIVSAGCSKDDDESDDQLTVNFQLQREDGRECYDFREGENIVFSLEIKNNTEEDVIERGGIGYFIGNGIFHVYSSQGEDFGTPYDMLIIPEVGFASILSKSSISFLCPWVNDIETELTWNPRYGVFGIDKTRPLPKGEYYSHFAIRLSDDRVVTCKKNFKIK